MARLRARRFGHQGDTGVTVARRLRKDDDRRGGCLLLVGAMVLMTAAIGLAILLAEPTFDSWGPWLETLTGWQRAGLGLVVGTAAAAPLLLLRLSRRIWLAAPLVFYAFTAWIHLTVTWMPAGRKGPTSRSISAQDYRAEADWYIVTSVLAFHVAVLLMLWLATRSSRPGEEEPVPGMVTRRRPKRRRTSAV